MIDDNDEKVRQLILKQEAAEQAARSRAQEPEKPPTAKEEGDLAGETVAKLRQFKYHPVLIVGASGAGKTTLLASLLSGKYAAGGRTEIDIACVDSLLNGSPSVAAETRRFVETILPEFGDSKVPGSTRFNHPFFIPIVITPKFRNLPPAKLAFLEIKGEKYHALERNDEYDESYLVAPQLPTLIARVLEDFGGPVSIIYGAPYDLRRGIGEEGRKQADYALLYALSSYQRLCKVRSKVADKHLALITKWDIYAGGVDLDEFTHPDGSVVEQVIADAVPQFWKKFCNARLGGRAGSHCFMQYSAGPIAAGESTLQAVAHRHHDTLHRYPRTVLNWLYRNATGNKTLFPDVALQRRSVVAMLSNRILRMVGAHGPA